MKKWKPKKAQEGIKFTPINIGDYRYDQQGNIVNNKTGEVGTLAIPEVRVTTTSPSSYRTSFDGGFDLINRISQGLSAVINKVNSSSFKDNPGFYIRDLSKEYVDRIYPETDDATSILVNEFVEDNPNNIRYVKDFKNTSDTLIGDNKIPLSNISQFYGVKNGKLIVGDLSAFNNNDVVIPIRNKNVGKIKKILLEPKDSINYYSNKLKSIRKKHQDARNNIYNTYAREHNIKPTIKQYITSIFTNMTPLTVAGADAYIQDNHRFPDTEYSEELQDIRGRIASPIKFITEQGDTINTSKIHTQFGKNKLLLGNEFGDSYFINNLSRIDKKALDTLNKSIEKNPVYPVLVDNGRYFRFYKNVTPKQNYKSYTKQDFYRDPQSLYVVGTRSIKK